MTFDIAMEQAKADRMPRYEQPIFYEEEEENDVATCQDCKCFMRFRDIDAGMILRNVNRYTHLYRSERDKSAAAKAIRRCGICAMYSTLHSASEEACEDGFTEK